MKNVNTFGVHFTIGQNKNVENKYTIYARIVVNKTRAELALKHWVRKEGWNPAKGFAKAKNEELNELNSYLESVRGKISSHYRVLDLGDSAFTKP